MTKYSKRLLESIFLTQLLRDVEMSSNENSKQCAGNEHALTKPDFESKRQSFPKLDELKTANVAIRYACVEKFSNIGERLSIYSERRKSLYSEGFLSQVHSGRSWVKLVFDQAVHKPFEWLIRSSNFIK